MAFPIFTETYNMCNNTCISNIYAILKLRSYPLKFIRRLTIVFILGPCRHNASIENGHIWVIKLPLSKPEFYKPSVDETYAAGITVAASCGHKFKLKGPKLQTCTTAGKWQQTYDEEDETVYSSNYLRKCLPGTNNIFLKLLREQFSYSFLCLIHEIHIIYE